MNSNTAAAASAPPSRKRARRDSPAPKAPPSSSAKRAKKTTAAAATGNPIRPPAEEKRLKRFRAAPPAAFDSIWARATSERFFVLKRMRCDAEGDGDDDDDDDDDDDCPEEEFELAGTTGNVYTIRIGRLPTCNCPYALKGNQCKHTVYILHRVLKAPRNLVYQLALLSSELREIYSKLPEETGADSGKNRKAVEGECAICYMDLDKDDKSAVVWCRAACGQNLHRVCFDTWARTCAGGGGGGSAVTCPLCRSPWDMDEENKGVAAAADADKGVVGEDGYVNVASQLGISGQRDYSTYHPYYSRYEFGGRASYENRRRRRYY